MTSFRHFQTEERGGVTLVKLHDPTMFNEFGDLHKELNSLVTNGRTEKLVVDFSATSSCPSAVVSALLMLQKDMGKDVKLCNLNAATRDTFRALGLDKKLFKIFETADDAIASFPT